MVVKSQQIRSSLLLVLTALIWGTAFVAQSVGMDYVGPYTFLCIRSILGGLVLLPSIALLQKISPQKQAQEVQNKADMRKTLLMGGVFCGIALFIASILQQIGIQMTHVVGKAGFITAFYIVFVPILGIFFHKKCGIAVWIGVMLALAGLYCLCMKEGFVVEKGDILLFLCALMYSGHILIIDHFSPLVDGVKMSCIQFFVCAAISAVPMVMLEHPQVSQILQAWQPIAYAGVLSSGVAYTLQIVGQKGLNPTVASLLMSLESVFSVLAGLVILGQYLTGREIIGCVLMFIAIILAQLPQKE